MATWHGFDCRLARESPLGPLAWAPKVEAFSMVTPTATRVVWITLAHLIPELYSLSNVGPINIFRRLRKCFRGHLSLKMLWCGLVQI